MLPAGSAERCQGHLNAPSTPQIYLTGSSQDWRVDWSPSKAFRPARGCWLKETYVSRRGRWSRLGSKQCASSGWKTLCSHVVPRHKPWRCAVVQERARTHTCCQNWQGFPLSVQAGRQTGGVQLLKSSRSTFLLWKTWTSFSLCRERSWLPIKTTRRRRVPAAHLNTTRCLFFMFFAAESGRRVVWFGSGTHWPQSRRPASHSSSGQVSGV